MTDDISDMFDTVYDLMSHADWDGLNDFVYHSSYTDQSQIVALLRTTYVVRSKLKDWDRSVVRYYKFLNRNQYNADAILKGLIDV